MTGGTTSSGPPAQQLRDVFDALATSVPAASTSNGYPDALAQWRRRERRRKLIVAILVAVVFAVADIIGLWALSKADVDNHIIFNNEPGTTQQAPAGAGIGPPP